MSYRNYVSNSLNFVDLVSVSKSAPDGLKYCNAFCQDFKSKDNFSNNIPTCKECRNKINLAIKQIREGSITLEEFKKNPEIVNGIDVVFDTLKSCNNCKQEKPINQFESGKNVCKACRSIQATNRNNKDFEILISDIEKAKHDLVLLENFVKSIAKDRLIKVISYYEIGRKSTDRKENMVYNIVEYFRKILNPNVCQGGCGFTLENEFTTCIGCQNKKEKPRAVSKMIKFTENIEEIVDNLKEITDKDFDTYNREQLYRIHEKLTGKKPKQKTLKKEVIEMINKELKKRDEKHEKEKQLEENIKISTFEGEITLNGITILSREDGFINATALCKAGGKEFKHWNSLEHTKEFIKVFEETQNKRSVAIPTDPNSNFQSIHIIKNGPNNKRGSWVHPIVAVQLAQWISPTFAAQVSQWIYELSVTGSVVLGQEKTQQQLIAMQKEILKQKDTINHITNKHKKLLEKRTYHKFKEGPVFYIISDNDSKSIKFKPGIEGSDINRRLAEHRSTTPAIKLEYLIYTKDNVILEKNILKRYNVKRVYQNHEWIYDITKEHIIDSVKLLLDFLNIEYTVEENLEEYNKHIEKDF